MYRSLSLFIAVSALFVSCVSGEKKPASVPAVQPAELSSVYPSTPLMNPRRMIVAGDHLVVFEGRAEHPFMVFSLPTEGMAYPAGHRGRGPGEVLSPDLKSFSSDGSVFSFMDSDGLEKVFCFSGDSLILSSSRALPHIHMPLNGVIRVGNGHINYMLRPSAYEYEYVDDITGETKDFLLRPSSGEGSDSNDMFSHLHVLLRHPSGEMFAAAYSFLGLIRYFDDAGTVIKECPITLEGVPGLSPDRLSFYTLGCCDQNRIVLKYGSDEIHVFDWSGEFIKRLKLDRNIDLMTVDFKRKTLYALDLNEDAPKLYMLVNSSF